MARRGLAQRSRDGIGRTRVKQSAIEHAALIWTRPADTIQARGMKMAAQRPDTCQYPTTRLNRLRKTLLRMGRLHMLHNSVCLGFTT